VFSTVTVLHQLGLSYDEFCRLSDKNLGIGLEFRCVNKHS